MFFKYWISSVAVFSKFDLSTIIKFVSPSTHCEASAISKGLPWTNFSWRYLRISTGLLKSCSLQYWIISLISSYMFICLTEFCCSFPTAGLSLEWVSSFSLSSCKLSPCCPFSELVAMSMLLWSLTKSLPSSLSSKTR